MLGVFNIKTTNGQYPWIINNEPQTFGQCFNISDCEIYTVIYPGLTLGDMFCNSYTSRCTQNNGNVLSPAFGSICQSMSLTVVVYPALDQYNSHDGMISVKINTNNPASALMGSLRLYLNSMLGTQNATITSQFVQEQYVNPPIDTYIFRNLDPASYEIDFFQQSGCQITAEPEPFVDIAFDGAYMFPHPISPPSKYFGVQWDNQHGFVVITNTTRSNSSVAFGKGVRTGLAPPWTPFDIHDGVTYLSDIGEGQRIPYVQFFDISGRVLNTYVGNQLLMPLPNAAGTGAVFPPNGRNNPLIISTPYEASLLSGVVSYQFGFGFALVGVPINATNPTLTFVQDYNGIYEGYLSPPVVINLASTAHMPAQILPGYNILPQCFQVDGIFVNTQFMYSGSNIFNASVLQKAPLLVVYPSNATSPTEFENSNSLCPNAGDLLGTVQIDYTPLPFLNNPLIMAVYAVDMTSTPTIEVVAVIPPFTVTTVRALPQYFDIASAGFYCVVLSGNLLDGRGIRPLLQTCFQVGRAASSATVVDSEVVQQRFPPAAYNHTVNAGFGSQIATTFHVGLPVTIVMQNGMSPWVVLFRASSDPDEMQQIIDYGGAVLNIFNDIIGMFNISIYYSIVTLPGPTPYQLYTLRNSIFNGPNAQFVVNRDVASSVLNEVAFSTLFFLNESLANGTIEFNVTSSTQTLTDTELVQVTTPTPVTFFNTTTMMNQTIIVDVVTFVPQLVVVNVTTTISTQLTAASTSSSNPVIQYACNTPAHINMVEMMGLQANMVIQPAVCPDQSAKFFGSAKGGFPFIFDNQGYQVPGQTPYSSFPFTDPATYYIQWVNDDPTSVGYGDILYAGLNAVLFPAPGNIRIKMIVYDVTGMTATATGVGYSLVSPNATIVQFLPQLPLCINGTQYVQLTYATNRDNDPTLSNKTDIIPQWLPLDVTAAELYNPNNPYFDLPANCSLLDTMSAYDVYFLCQAPGANSSNFNCTGCTRLPIQYSQTINNGRSILTSINNEWWQVIVWIRTNVYDITTKRYVYCQTALSIKTTVPNPLSLTFSQLTRISGSGPGVNTTCASQTCFSVIINPVVDVNYVAQYPPSLVVLSSIPPLQLVNPQTSLNTYSVALGVVYNITIFIGNNFCPVSINYLPTANGPEITLIQTWPTQCNSNNGQVWIYMRYNNINLAVAGTSVPLCLYWPNRHGTNVPTDSIPLPFMAPVDQATSTVLPNSFFGNIQSFAGIRGGLHNLMIYDACNAITQDCNCILPGTFQLTNPSLLFAFDSFSITNFNNPAGNLYIDRTGFNQAQCFGDSYYLNFTVYDNAGPSGLGNGPYAISFFKPFGLGVYQTFSTCSGHPALPPPVPFGTSQVIVAQGLQVVIPTGGIQGLGVSGNYTLSVLSCTTQCVATFETFIDIVQPLYIVLSSAMGTCAYNEEQLVPLTGGGKPFLPGNNESVQLTYVYPGSSVIHFSPYKMFWKTPFNPFNFTQLFLQLNVIPGFYELMIIDANQCNTTANITVLTAPPIEVRIAGYNGVCQVANQSVVRLNVSGGIPPYIVLSELDQVITSNTTIDASFVATYNQTTNFFIMDSSGCMLPTPVSFVIPDPGPVNLTIDNQPSCLTVNTGIVHVTSTQAITCRWQAVGASLPLVQTCTLTGIPAETLLTVTASTIIGCTAIATFTVGTKPPIVMIIVDRTTMGQYNGPCIDSINISITGGLTGVPYIVNLVNDVTNATLIYNGNNTILITGVCRSYIYTVLAMEHTFTCPVTIVSTDPGFIFGGGPADGLLGLPSPNNALFLPPPPPGSRHKFNWLIAAPIIALLSAIMLAFGLYTLLKRRGVKPRRSSSKIK